MKILEKINLQPRPIFLKDRTTFQIGGFCPTFYEPANVEELLPLWQLIQAEGIPTFLLGAGSNVLASDDEIQQVIISLNKWKGISVTGTTLTAQAGALANQISQTTFEHSLSGFEFIYGLPATLGGALFMNARCFGGEISDNLREVLLLNAQGEIETYAPHPADFDYKISPFQKKNCIILRASFDLKAGDPAAIKSLMQTNWQNRHDRGHFRAPSGGSYFKNNYSLGVPSGTLIDEVGMKGAREGGAQVAPWHGNFLINARAATAADVLVLARRVKEKVLVQKGIELKEEVLFLS